MEKLFSYSEVGYLEGIVDEIMRTPLLESFKIFIYFKTTWSKWDLDESSLDACTLLFLVVDENDFIPSHLNEKVHTIFKHYLKEDIPEKNIFHLPIGPNVKITVPLRRSTIKERDINVFFWKFTRWES